MTARAGKRHRRARLTSFAWLVIGLAVAVAIGFAIGSRVVWIAALVLLLFMLLGAFAVPRNVRDLNVPPWLGNMTGDETRDETDERD